MAAVMRCDLDAFFEREPGLSDHTVPAPAPEVRVTRGVATWPVGEDEVRVREPVEALPEIEFGDLFIGDRGAPTRGFRLGVLDYLAALCELPADVQHLLIAVEIGEAQAACLCDPQSTPHHQLDLISVCTPRRLPLIEPMARGDEAVDLLGCPLVVLALRVAGAELAPRDLAVGVDRDVSRKDGMVE